MENTKKLSESYIQSEILDFLNRNKIFCFRVNTTGTWDKEKQVYRNLGKFQLKGTHDIIGILPDGKFFSIEVKRETGRPTLDQVIFMEKIKNNNGISFIAKNLQDVKDNLERYLN